MALSIKDPVAERLARELALKTGETITAATRRALQERLMRVADEASRTAMLENLVAIRLRWASLPILDPRTSDDILGYDEQGLPR